MISLNGTYENGVIKLERKMDIVKKTKVIVTFLDEEQSEKKTGLTLSNFSFIKSREQSQRYKGALSDTVIEERRKEL
jgi:predicted DNA-binding antitoxin AbrB/MazE fold protein